MVVPGTQGVLVEVKEYKQVNGAKGATTVQSFKLQDGNDWIFGDAWGMQDLSPWMGKHVIFVANKGGNNKLAGVSIKEKKNLDGSKTYKNLSISGACTMHDKDTFEASRGAAPQPGLQPQPPASSPAPFVPKPAVVQQQPVAPQTQPAKQASIQGVTVGMAINNAIHILIATKAFDDGVFETSDFDLIHSIASGIIGVSKRLERGDLGRPSDVVDSVVTRIMNNPLSGAATVPPPARPRPEPGPHNSAFPVNQDEPDDDSIPF